MEQAKAALDKPKRDEVAIAFPEHVRASQPQSPTGSPWENLPRLEPDRKRLARSRIVTLAHTNEATFSFDIMRTKIMKALRQNNWTSVAITSATPGCGKTVVGLNLAFSFANLKDCRTVLVDLDLRRPQVGAALGAQKIYAMERFLKGETPMEEVFLRCGQNLVVGLNSYPVTYAAELLQSPTTAAVLCDLKDKLKPDVMLFDLPPMLVNDDVLAFLPNVDCALLVVAAESSTIGEVDICERTLTQETNLVGVVLNKCEHGPEKYGY